MKIKYAGLLELPDDIDELKDYLSDIPLSKLDDEIKKNIDAKTGEFI